MFASVAVPADTKIKKESERLFPTANSNACLCFKIVKLHFRILILNGLCFFQGPRTQLNCESAE